MEVKILKAGSGDSILVHHKKSNILIDGGNDSKYLISEIDNIYTKKEIIDLLIITHHDDDHIKGIIDLLNHINENKYNKDSEFIKKVIFNSPRKVLGKLSKDTSNNLSYKQAYEVEELLEKTNVEWEIHTDKSESIKYNDLVLDFLSPTKEDIDKYSSKTGAYLTGDNKNDWKSSMSQLDKYIDDKSQDKSVPNKSSVVLKIQTDDKKILLTGDVTPDRLELILDKLSKENNNLPVEFDYVKLPSHGSYRSMSKKIIEKLKCKNFIISTNSKKYYLPNKRTLLKILKFSDRTDNQPINFIFNYDESITNLEISKKEKIDYNFKLTPNNKSYGFSF